MASVRKLFVKGFAVIVVIAGVGSLFTLGIMAGVKVAYAASDDGVVAYEEQSHYIRVMDAASKQRP